MSGNATISFVFFLLYQAAYSIQQIQAFSATFPNTRRAVKRIEPPLSSSLSSSLTACYASTATNAPAAVSVVSVCTAELCCCQEEGGSALEILENLNARSLSYPVEEAPCLGACGGGAMVAIDFEDGSAALVSGLEETLAELGLSNTNVAQSASESPSTVDELKEELPVVITGATGMDTTATEIENGNSIPSLDNTIEISKKQETVSSLSIIQEQESKPKAVEKVVTAPITATTQVTPFKKSKQYQMTSDDVRDRMRAEAAQDSEQINPWLNMASYLAGKARDKILGSNDQ